jgi:cytochrome P450
MSGPNLFAADFKANPYPVYEQMRQFSPVRAVDVPTGRLWLVTRYADARQVLTDPRFTKVAPDQHALQPPGAAARPDERLLSEHMLSVDPPAHTRLRRLVNKVFTAGRIEALRPRVREIADDLLDGFADKGEVDLVAGYAFPLPITVICELLGVPMDDRDSFRDWSNAVVGGMASGGDNRQAAQALATYVVDLIAVKRAALGDDLLSQLIAVTDGGDRLSERELVSMVFLLLIAGHETTVNLIANGAYLLLTHPDALRRVTADPGLIPGAVEEFLRYESPVETTTPRFTSEPVEIGGVTIPAGEVVLVSLSSVNRDEARFAEPARFDIDRRDTPHLAFGHGIHFCLGAPLARMEGRVAFERMLPRLPELALAVPAGDLAWRPGLLIRGLVDLPVRWSGPAIAGAS